MVYFYLALLALPFLKAVILFIMVLIVMMQLEAHILIVVKFLIMRWTNAIYEAVAIQLEIKAPFVEMTKADIVKIGLSLGVPYQLTWSC